MKAIDCGNYTPVPTSEQVRCLLDQGYTRAIVGSSYGKVWEQQIAAFSAGGMDVDEYQFPGALRPTTRRWWLDAETPAATVSVMRSICRMTPPTGIYTRRGWWVDNTGDWDIKAEFPFLKLWDASYADPPPAFIPYGGFTERAIHQWHDSTTLCGLNVDLNIIEEAPPIVIIEESEDMKPIVVFNTTDKSVYLVGPFSSPILIGDAGEVAAFEKLYGPQIALSDGTMRQIKP